MPRPRIIALLNWYDEADEFLYKGIKSLAKAEVDHVVAVDGAYALFPDGHAQSQPSNAETIQRACDEIGAGCTIHIPEQTWQGNEMEKRTFLFRLAEEVSQPLIDWLFVWDADQQLAKCENLKHRLEATDLDAADLRVIEPADPLEPGQYWPGTKLRKPKEMDVRLMYRAIPGIYCHGNHYTYCTPDGRYLWGHGTDPLVPGLAMEDVVVLHKTKRRQVSRTGRAVRYYNIRKQARVEDRTCRFCGNDEALEEDIVHDWQWVKRNGRWHITGALVSACRDCRIRYGTQRDKPLILTCPECKGKTSRHNPCIFCKSKGYKVEDPRLIEQSLMPVIAKQN